MNRLEHLISRYLDDELTPDETSELAGLLESDPQQARKLAELFLQSRALEAHYRLNTELAADAVMSELLDARHVFVRGVMDEVGIRRQGRDNPVRTPWFSLIGPRGFPQWGYAAVVFASLLCCFGLWHFSPTMGEPVLGDVSGSTSVIERMGASRPATKGTKLFAGDVLRTSTNGAIDVLFGVEATRFALAAETELRLISVKPGKRFELRVGKLEADVAPQRPFKPLVVTTPNAEAVVVGTRFTLTAVTNRTQLDVAEGWVRLADTSGAQAVAAVKVGAGQRAVVAPATELAALPTTGRILREWWSGVPGPAIQELLNDERYPNQPNGREFLSALELAPVGTNAYASRIRGYIHPAVTGDHVFWMAAASTADLFFSLSDEPEEKFRIASSSRATPRHWDQEPNRGAAHVSNPFHLVAGRRYYVEALLKVNQGQGHLSVAWQQPGKKRELISGEFLSPAEPGK